MTNSLRAPRPASLAGLVVLDLSRVLAGPFCTMLLGDLGADVIKVEEPRHGDETRQWGPPYVAGESTYYLAINRNKRSLTLDLARPEARDLLFRLSARADVLVENFKTGTMERWDLGYERLREANPGLVYCNISGFGPDGPYRDRPGYDFIAQGMGGLMTVTGEPDGDPLKAGVAITDLFTGLYACTATLAALRQRDRSGQGQRVDVSLLESAVASLVNVASNFLQTSREPGRYGNAHPSIVPYQVFRAADKPFIVAVGNDGQFRRLCDVLDRPELALDPRFARNPARVEHRQELVGLLEAAFHAEPASEWVDRLLAAGVPAGPVNTLHEVFEDPQVLHREMLLQMAHPSAGTVRTAGIPFKLSETPAAARLHPPLLGEHSAAVLSEFLGLQPGEIERLRASGVV